MGFVLLFFLFFCLFVCLGVLLCFGRFFLGGCCFLLLFFVVVCLLFRILLLCLLLFAHSILYCLYLFKAQARCPGHTPVCLYVCLSRTVSRFC